jgi:hypothetical protein
MAQLENGAVLVARITEQTEATVIGRDGRRFSFRSYLENPDANS